MTDLKTLRTYTDSDFAVPGKDCDIVMKGGITSGVGYPYAILEIARAYRFRSIGGTSAGAVAAAFAAAAEYSRVVRGDPSGFLRLQDRCSRIPHILIDLLQPERRFRGLMPDLESVLHSRFVFSWSYAKTVLI